MENATKQIIITRAANIAESIKLLSNLYHEIETLATSDEINEFITPLFPFNASLDDLWADTEKWVQGMKDAAETDRRAERYAKITANAPVPAVFTIDGGDPFVGVHYPQYRWNGWAIPYFTKEEGDRFVAFYNGLDSSIKFAYDEAKDAFTSIDDSDPENTIDTYPAQDINGQQLYSIGGCYFVWDAEQPKTFFEQDHSGRDGHGEITLIDICSDADNQEEYTCTDEDDRENSIIHWALNAEIGDTYQDGASTYTRTK